MELKLITSDQQPFWSIVNNRAVKRGERYGTTPGVLWMDVNEY
jgi:hypothetical protein